MSKNPYVSFKNTLVLKKLISYKLEVREIRGNPGKYVFHGISGRIGSTLLHFLKMNLISWSQVLFWTKNEQVPLCVMIPVGEKTPLLCNMVGDCGNHFHLSHLSTDHHNWGRPYIAFMYLWEMKVVPDWDLILKVAQSSIWALFTRFLWLNNSHIL